MLREFNARKARPLPVGREEHNHCRGRADHQRVDEDAERLHQSLLHRVRGVGGGGRIRHRTHAGFVRKETALHARHDGKTKARAHGGIEAEGARNDELQHIGNQRDVHHGHDERHQKIGAGHHRNEHADHLRDAGKAAEDHETGKDRDDKPRVPGIGAQRRLERERDGIGLDAVEDEAVGNGEKHGKEPGKEGRPQHIADVVGGSAHVAPALSRRLIDLSER